MSSLPVIFTGWLVSASVTSYGAAGSRPCSLRRADSIGLFSRRKTCTIPLPRSGRSNCQAAQASSATENETRG